MADIRPGMLDSMNPLPKRRVGLGMMAMVVFVMASCLFLVITRMVGGEDEPPPGEPGVYTSIAAETDCAALQWQFDTAETNATAARARGNTELAWIATSYMAAADNRMRDLTCYE